MPKLPQILPGESTPSRIPVGSPDAGALASPFTALRGAAQEIRGEAEKFTDQALELQRRQREAEDAIAATKARVKLSLDMADLDNSMRQAPDFELRSHADKLKVGSEGLLQRSLRGLSPGAATRLQQQGNLMIGERVIHAKTEYHKTLAESTDVVNAQLGDRLLVEAAGTDDVGRAILTEQYERETRALGAQGLIGGVDGANKRIDAWKERLDTSRIYALVNNGQYAEAAALAADPKRTPGLKPDDREKMKKFVTDQAASNESRTIARINFKRSIDKEELAKYEKARDEDAAREVTGLVRNIFKGTVTPQQVDDLAQHNWNLQQHPERVEHLMELLEQRATKGVVTNPAAYAYIWNQIRESRGAADATGLVLRYQHALSNPDQEKLIAIGEKARENTAYKDDYYQAAVKAVDRAFQFGIGFPTLDAAKGSRYNAAQQALEDTATRLIREGKRDQIPAAARAIIDHFNQDVRTTVKNPAFTPRYNLNGDPAQGVAATVEGFKRDYGPDPAQWPLSVQREYARQERFWREAAAAAQAEAEQKAAAEKSAAEAKKKSSRSLFSPFKGGNQ